MIESADTSDALDLNSAIWTRVRQRRDVGIDALRQQHLRVLQAGLALVLQDRGRDRRLGERLRVPTRSDLALNVGENGSAAQLVGVNEACPETFWFGCA